MSNVREWMVCGLLVASPLLFASCGKSKSEPLSPQVDASAPSAVQDLGIIAATDSSVLLAWTAPGDDGDVGIATHYDLRFSATPTVDWNSASVVSGAPRPEPAGTRQTTFVRGLSHGAGYFFALRTEDESSNWSHFSNVAGGADAIPPAPIRNLVARNQGTTEIELLWTASGDDSLLGFATGYEIRYTTDALGLSTPGGWAQAGVLQSGSCGSEHCFARATSLVANTAYYFGVRAVDEAGNWSGISNIASETTQENPPQLMATWPIAVNGRLDAGKIAVDPQGFVYVSAPSNPTTIKLDRYGAEVGHWDRDGDMGIDSNGNVHQISGAGPAIETFDPNGALLAQWGTLGTGPGQFSNPTAIAIDPYDNIYVLDSNAGGGGRVLTFRPASSATLPPVFVRAWPLTVQSPTIYDEPVSLAVDRSHVYVVGQFTEPNSGFDMLQKYDKEGTLLWSRRDVALFNPVPAGMATDAAGNVQIAEMEDIVKISPTGSTRMICPISPGYVGDVAIDARGAIYVLTEGAVLLFASPSRGSSIATGTARTSRSRGQGL